MHSELSSPSGVSSIFSPFLDLGSPTSILSDSKLFLSSRTASPNLENSWVQISRDESFSPPFDWGSRHAAPDSVIVPPLGASFYETGDAIETGDSDCTDDEDEDDCSKDAAVEEALRASLATLLASRNLSQLETEIRTSASSPKSTVVGTESGCYSSAVHACPLNHSIQAAPLSRADVPIDRKPTVITPGSDLRYKYAPPTSPFNLSVQGMNATRAPHHSRLSAQKNAPTFLDKPCLLCSLHLCRKQVSNQHRTISSSPPSPKLQCFPARKSASCPTTPPPTPLLIPRKKKDPPYPSSRCTLKPGEIVHASKRTLKGRESFHRAAGIENPNVKGNEAIIGPSDANDKNRGDSNGDCPEGIIAWITRMWLNAGLKIKVLSAIALSAMILGTGLSARSYFHRIRINTAIYTTSVLRL